MSCGPNIQVCTPGPQGPQGPTGPTGPAGGQSGVSIVGNVAGAPALISSGTLYLSGGNNVTLSQNGQSIGISGGGGIAASVGGNTAGLAALISAGTMLLAGGNNVTLSQNANSVTISGGPGLIASVGGNTTGTLAQISSGTLVLAGGNNVTLSQVGNSVTISANTAAAATLSVSAGASSGAFGGVTFSNGSNVSFGLNNGTITASVVPQSTQTQPAGNIAGIGTTFAGTNISASMTLNSSGLNLALSGPNESGIGLSAAGSSQSAGALVLSNSNGVSFGMNGSTITASVVAGGGGGIDLTLAGNTSGTLALVSTGTVTLAGGNNITLSQVGNAITISGANAGGAQTGISGIQVSNTTYSSGTVTFQNANGISFGSSGANGISASYTVPTQSVQPVAISGSNGSFAFSTLTAGNLNGISHYTSNGSLVASYNSTQFAGTATTFNGANISGSMTLNSAGLNLSLSGNAGSAGSSGGIYNAGNTTGQSSSSTYAQSSLNVSFAGILSGGWSSNSLIISAPGTTGLSQMSLGISGGNTSGNTGTVAQGQVVLAGGNNITLSGSTNGSNMTITISAGAGGGGGFSGGVSTGGNTSGNTGTQTGQFVLAGGNNITLSVGTAAGGAQTITISAGAGGGASTAGLYALGNTTQNSSTTLALSALSFNALGAMTMGYSNSSIQVSAPATSSISGTGIVSVSVNGSTISIGAAQPQLSAFQALPANVTTATQIGQGSVLVYPVFQPEAFTATQGDALASISASSSSNSSYAGAISVYMGVYTRNASTLSLASSGSQSYQFSNTSNNSVSVISGVRRLTTPLNVNYTGNQDLYVALMTLTTSTNANWFTASNVAVPWGNTAQMGGVIGAASNATKQYVPGMGTFSTTSNAMPASMAFSQISGLGSTGNYLPLMNFFNFTA